MMKIPNSLKKITSHFHQDVFLIGSLSGDFLYDAIQPLTLSERKECAAYLGDLLGESPNLDRIRSVWEQLPKEIRLEDDQQKVEFLRQLGERLKTTN